MTIFLVSCDAQDKKAGPDSRKSNSWSQFRGAEEPASNEGFQHPPWILAEAQKGSVETLHSPGKQIQPFPLNCRKKTKAVFYFSKTNRWCWWRRIFGALAGQGGNGICHPLVPDAARSLGCREGAAGS